MHVDFPNLAERAALARNVEVAEELGRRFDALKAFYDGVLSDILAAPAHRWAIPPYAVDWQTIFSPIEWIVWCEMRNCGAVLYPQYPIGRYFADFANPVARVVIECDGKEFHTDWRADERRQADIEARGWTVYRISGARCMSPEYMDQDDEGNDVGTTSLALQFVEDIARRHQLSVRFAAIDA